MFLSLELSSHADHTDQIDHDLDHPARETCLTVVGHAGYTAPTRQHEPDHTDRTDHTDHTDQEYICPAWQI